MDYLGAFHFNKGLNPEAGTRVTSETSEEF
jgi:hypothetical protein